MDPALQQIMANKSAQDAQNASGGAGMAIPFAFNWQKGFSPSMPHVGVSLNVAGQHLDAALLPKMRDLMGARMMPGIFSSKGGPPKGPQGIDATFLDGGTAIMSAGFDTMGDLSMKTPGSGRGDGMAMRAHNFEYSLSPTSLSSGGGGQEIG